MDVRFVEKLPELVSLETLKDDPDLEGMLVRMRGQRLSIQPVEEGHFRHVLELGGAKWRHRRKRRTR